MWDRFSEFIFAYKRVLLIIIAALTVFMGYQATKAELSYDFVKIVPPNDPEMIFFRKFLATFGEDSNIFAIALKDSTLYEYDTFKKFNDFAEDIKKLDGVAQTLSLPQAFFIAKDTVKEVFALQALFNPFPANQTELDSMLRFARKIKAYEGQLYNADNGATLLLITIKKGVFNTPARAKLIFSILERVEKFESDTKIDLHCAGVPYVRSVVTEQLKRELNMFLALSLAVTVAVLFFFFRSFTSVFFPILLIAIVIVWAMGTIVLFNYKITMLTGLLPSILVVIGIPNCVYLLTKYHQEFVRLHDKHKALKTVIKKIGIITFATNFTTAIGFLVLLMTNISILEEFGIVASLNIIVTFFLSLIFIPAVYAYLPAPSERHRKHLEFAPMKKSVALMLRLVLHHRPLVYITSVLLCVVAIFGIYKINAVSFMVDDLPKNSSVMKDLAFFEANFNGIMPLEIMIDMGNSKGLQERDNLKRIDSLQRYLATHRNLSPAVSPITLLKAANQAYFDYNPKAYRLPSTRPVQKYLENQQAATSNAANKMISNFIDSTGKQVRLSLKVADLGSVKMDSLIKGLVQPQAEKIFEGSTLKAHITGTTLLFIKGNAFLINNLKQSLALAIVLVAAVIGLLFMNIRIMILAVIPNLIPLLLTAALMGFADIPLKPSTALIFSIAFGIAVDDAIHFLARYRLELIHHNFNIIEAVRVSISETGQSMIYTSVVLFAGFIIFAGSDFGGTQALGILTSTTLFVAMFSNLILLPSLLITFDKNRAARMAKKIEVEETA